MGSKMTTYNTHTNQEDLLFSILRILLHKDLRGQAVKHLYINQTIYNLQAQQRAKYGGLSNQVGKLSKTISWEPATYYKRDKTLKGHLDSKWMMKLLILS